MPLGGNALVSQMNKLSLEPGEMVTWQRGPTPPSHGGVLPPRGASLGEAPLPSRAQSLGPPSNPPEASLPQRGVSLSRARQPSGNLMIPAVPPVPAFIDFPLGMPGSSLPRSPSGRSVQSQPRLYDPDIPPVPIIRGPGSHMSDPALSARNLPPQAPSARFSSFPEQESLEPDSPPPSPLIEDAATLSGPAVISAQMKCKVFLKQSHAQWKSLGSGKLKLYVERGRNIKQLVVEADGGKSMLISTIVLTDGVERVAKTGVAVEISDKGKRTGIVYMIQLRNENSAAGLFESLLAGSDRHPGGSDRHLAPR